VWVVKGLLFLVLLFVLVWFFAANGDQSVDIKVLGRTYMDINIYWVVSVCYLLGFATSFSLAAVRELRFHREIADLRTLPLSDAHAPRTPAAPARSEPPARTSPPEGAAP